MSPLLPIGPPSGSGYLPVFSGIGVTPATASLSAGSPTQAIVATTLDQRGLPITVPAATFGNRLIIPASGWLATAAAIANVASLSGQAAFKWCATANLITGIGAGLTEGFFEVDGNGLANNTNAKIWLTALANGGATQAQLSQKTGTYASEFGPTPVFASLPGPTADIIGYSVFDSNNTQFGTTIFDAFGNVLFSFYDTTTHRGGLNTTGGNGFVVVNAAQSATAKVTATHSGLAIYSAPLPASQQFTPPTASDPNLVALWLYSDAPSGNVPTSVAAQVGGQPLVLKAGTPTWTTGSAWSGTPGTPINFGSDNQAVATVNSSGTITRVAPGTCNVRAWIGQIVTTIPVACT